MPLLSKAFFFYTTYFVLRYEATVARLCARVRRYYCLWTLFVVYLYNFCYLIWQFILKSAILLRFTADKTEKNDKHYKNCSQIEDKLWFVVEEVLNNPDTGIKKENKCEEV